MNLQDVREYQRLTLNPSLRNGYRITLEKSDQAKFLKVAKLAQAIGKKIDLNCKVSLKLSSLNSPYGVWVKRKSKKAQLSIHPVLLVEKENLPDELQLNGLSDSKYNWFYVSKFRNWFQKKFSIPEDKTEWNGNVETTYVYERYTEQVADFFAHLQEDFDQFWPVMEFAITRELLHLKKMETKPLPDFFGWLRGNKKLSSREAELTISDILFRYGFTLAILECIPLAFIADVFPGSKVLQLCSVAFSLIFLFSCILWNIVASYRRMWREREVCKEAVMLTGNIRAAKLFYQARKHSAWEGSFRIFKWLFRPIENALGELSDRHIDQICSS